MNEFKKLGIDKNTLKTIESLGYEKPTEIQEKSIPIIIKGEDIIAQSATGTGKTFAFLSGIINKINPDKNVQAIVLTPTRELAIQIHKEGEKFSKNNKVNFCVVYGGESISLQKRELKKAHIVVATPGRLLDHINRNNINLNNLKHFILDEADRMSDMGFIDDIKKILERTPKEKQMLLFSATITKDVSTIEKRFMKNAKRVSAEVHVDRSKLSQEYYKIHENKKISLLVHLTSQNKKKSIVFCNTRSAVDLVEYNLNQNNVKAFKLHGGMEQRKRTHIISLYHKHKYAILVSTDVAARGIHIDNINYIYNFDVPREKTQYVHRIGRTARAGEEGKAISFVSPKDLQDFLKIGKKYKFDFINKKLPDFEFLDLKRVKKDRSRNKSNHQRRFDKIQNQINDIKDSYKSKDQNIKDKREEKEKNFRKKQVRDKFKHKRRTREKKYKK